MNVMFIPYYMRKSLVFSWNKFTLCITDIHACSLCHTRAWIPLFICHYCLSDIVLVKIDFLTFSHSDGGTEGSEKSDKKHKGLEYTSTILVGNGTADTNRLEPNLIVSNEKK